MDDRLAPRIKNRAPATVQVTAEHFLREAHGTQQTSFRAPSQRLQDLEELDEYRARKRQDFEQRVMRNRANIKEWVNYAKWEASQSELPRARSIFERALDENSHSILIWLAYVDLELKARNVSHALNLLLRGVTLLPRASQLWYKHVYLSELLQDIPGTRQVFERWMQWQPEDGAWSAYVKFEERYGELDRASAVFTRWVGLTSEPKVWVKWAKFEEERGRVDRAREVLQAASERFGEDGEGAEKAQAVFAAFAKMETKLKEYERARTIYKFALSRIPQSRSTELLSAYTKFEKQHGTQRAIEDTAAVRRRVQYEADLSKTSHSYDTWLEYIRVEEDSWRQLKDEGVTPEARNAAAGRVVDLYERAVAQIPLTVEKGHWRRYIFLWLNYALFEEIERKDHARARKVYQTAIQVVPHKHFTFAKLWLMFAKFELRQLDVNAARKIMGTAIGMCPKGALLKGYVNLEIKLREFDRVQKLYEKYIEFDPTNSSTWIQYATLEAQLGDFARTRAIFELALCQPSLSMPELLWKAFIDFEIEQGDRQVARALYERLVALSGHVNAWISYATFEVEPMPATRDDWEEEQDAKEREMMSGDSGLARAVFERAYRDLRRRGLKDERAALLEAWKTFEEKYGNPEGVAKVESMKPVGVDRGLIFPDDDGDAHQASLKFLQAARAWKQAQEVAEE
ncbi:unnamed protein product [Cyclocybe aegerita]|uniref:Pre-mRNA-splicing factor CLF1 n=1 Tax=Cyclocybe aegerita TaxID=1973307 RepID=A0A8S0WAX6_CYCAE|nr:unnamed protein product [Cyclocybe aegerita]